MGQVMGQAIPIVEYLFSGPNDTLQQSTGMVTDNGARLSIRDSSNTAAALTAELGVSGLAGDWALDFRSAPGTGSNAGGDGPFARTDGDLQPVDGLASFTLQGWFNTNIVPTDNMEFFKNVSSSAGFMLKAVNDGALRLYVNGDGGGSAIVSQNKDWAITGEWVFFAVTYDGTSTTDNASFYMGGINESVALSSTQTLDQGPALDESNRLVISRRNRPYQGLLDNMRVYGSTGDASGVLSMSDLETVRLTDVTGVPEPSTFAILAACFSMGFVFWQRKRSRSSS